MNIEEEVGFYKVIASGTVIVFNNEPITLSLIENGKGLPIRFEFTKDESKDITVSQRIEGGTMIIDFRNANNPGAFGLPCPIDIAKSDDGENVIYFCCVLNTFNPEGGNRLLTYSFYSKK